MEKKESFEIVKANNTEEDAHHYATLAEIAADGLFSFLYGSKSYSLLKYLFLEENTIPNHSITYFVKNKQKIAGEITCYTYEYHEKNNERSEKKITDYLGWKVVRLLAASFMLRLMRVKLEGVKPEELYIESIAIYEEYRKKKLSKLLLNQAEKLAIENGCNKLSLDVEKKNTIAIAAYEKVGFEVLESTKNKKIVKMIKWIS